MFHEGNLQSGISLAIQEQKLVGILVRDNGAESATWENDWLKSGWVSNLLDKAAVLLRLEADSTEAGYLSAFCTIESSPTFVVIHNGQLKEQLSSGVTQDEFINRVRKVLGATPIPSTGSASAPPRQTSSPTPAQASTPAAPVPEPIAPAVAPSPAPTPPPPTAKDKGKQKATAPDSKPPTSTTKVQQAARDALRKKQQEEKDELARIKARIEQDKAERRAQAEARKAERERENQALEKTSEPSQFTVTSTRGSQANEVHLNVRLFDGGTVRKTFLRTAKLENDVRPWVDQEAAARAENPNDKQPPYYFKQILAPLPSKELSAGEEAETLGDIDLAPSATLVLVPVKGYTEAYAGGPTGIVYGAAGNVMSLVGGAFNVAGSVLGYVGNTVSSVLGGGASSVTQPDAQSQSSGGRSLGESQQQGQTSSAANNIRVRTLADQQSRDQNNQNFYNGNQVCDMQLIVGLRVRGPAAHSGVCQTKSVLKLLLRL
ncbi:hypothetical protein CC80DRAFT_468202 [Byssothecium circinans]|uniref:UBX domain-containing protein 2 n=1 Tax=Byssothecium circinans TaxID=147558 RepID=A0A6A5U122_9PLEO|nr:hypothetical protein CC80DRAFT_468202 [Byssothecium circinans]